jgi:hypothetical protein
MSLDLVAADAFVAVNGGGRNRRAISATLTERGKFNA